MTNTVSNKGLFENIGEFFSKIKLPCILISFLSSIGFIIGFTVNTTNPVIEGILLAVICIGLIAALLSGPAKYILVIFGAVAGGFAIGKAVVPYYVIDLIGAFIGAMLGLMLGVIAFLFAPGVIGLISYLKN